MSAWGQFADLTGLIALVRLVALTGRIRRRCSTSAKCHKRTKPHAAHKMGFNPGRDGQLSGLRLRARRRGRLRRPEEARINPAVRGRGGVADLHPVLIPRGDAELETHFRHLHRLR